MLYQILAIQTRKKYKDNIEEGLLWMAPEVLTESYFNLYAFRQGLMKLPRGKTRQADVYRKVFIE